MLPRQRDQDHAEGHRPGDGTAEDEREQEGECRQQDELAGHAEEQGPGFGEDLDEGPGLDAEGDAVHHEREHDVDGVHPAGVQRHFNSVNELDCFR